MSEALTVRETSPLDSIRSHAGWLAYGRRLSDAGHFLQFKIGDWLNFGHDKYDSGKYEEGLALFPQYGIKTLYQFSSVASGVQVSIRIETLSWAHHQLVAWLDLADQVELLKLAAADGLTISGLRRAIGPKKKRQKKKRKRAPNSAVIKPSDFIGGVTRTSMQIDTIRSTGTLARAVLEMTKEEKRHATAALNMLAQTAALCLKVIGGVRR